MSEILSLHEDRYFSSDPVQRKIARDLYNKVKDFPIISPHGHVEPVLFAENKSFPDPTELLVIPDHYLYRMLYSQGIPMESLGVPRVDEGETSTDSRKIWQIVGDHFYLFRGTPTGMWLKHELHTVFGIKKRLSHETAMEIYDQLTEALAKPENFPRAMFERFNIEVLSTTDSPIDPLQDHQKLMTSGWKGRIVPAYRPDNVTDLLHPDWRENIDKLAECSGIDCTTYKGYLEALKNRRSFFKDMGCTSSDHGVTIPLTIDLNQREAENLYAKALKGDIRSGEASIFTGHMLMEMAAMSIEDGFTMQIHVGVFRNYNTEIWRKFGTDKGCDIPIAVDITHDLHPLLDKYGNNPQLNLILFTIDESTYTRELAPLAGHFPALRLGPAWWFNDSREGMLRYRKMITETAGFYNTVGFNDDTRAFPSIPARHDLARRVDARYLAELVGEHVLDLDEAEEIIVDLTSELPKTNYHL